MSALFDLKEGRVFLDSGAIISREFRQEDLTHFGFTIARDFSVKPDWYHVTIQPIMYGGRETYFHFLFKDSKIQNVNFWFKPEVVSEKLASAEIPSGEILAEMYEVARKSAPLLFSKYAGFLRRELGEPASRDDRFMKLRYGFAWGAIGILYDPHNFHCAIYLNWSSVFVS